LGEVADVIVTARIWKELSSLRVRATTSRKRWCMLMTMQIKPQFTFDRVRFDQETSAHLVLSITAPKSDWQRSRPPICVIPVLDVSGSMSGPKIEYAKKSLLKLVEHLSSEDYFGLVSFSSGAFVDFEVCKLSQQNKELAKGVIGRYQANGSTNLSTGMLLGFHLANKLDLSEAAIVRVILFTDGQPTHGITDQKGICELVAKQAGRTSVSAFGYGSDACQELLSEVSTTGKGNYAFVQDPDAALAAFGKELGGLLSSYAQDIVIELSSHNGHQITEIVSDVDVEEESTGEVRIKVPHMLSEETVNLVSSVKLTPQKQPGPRQVNAFELKLTYQVVTSEGKLETKTEESKAKIQFVKAGEEQSSPTKEVDEIVARAQLVKAQVEAEAAAKLGDFQAAGVVFKRLNLQARGHGGIAAVADHVAGLYSSQTRYGSSAENRIGLRRAMTCGPAASAIATEDNVVLKCAGYTMSTSAQNELSEQFSKASQVSAGTGTVSSPPVELSEKPSVPVEPERTRLSKSRSARW